MCGQPHPVWASPKRPCSGRASETTGGAAPGPRLLQAAATKPDARSRRPLSRRRPTADTRCTRVGARTGWPGQTAPVPLSTASRLRRRKSPLHLLESLRAQGHLVLSTPGVSVPSGPCTHEWSPSYTPELSPGNAEPTHVPECSRLFQTGLPLLSGPSRPPGAQEATRKCCVCSVSLSRFLPC